MSIANYFIDNKVVTWSLICLLTVSGYISFINLSKLEDPTFTIKEAMVITLYPGATSLEVEEEVTDTLEKAIQKLPQLRRTSSRSLPGYSEIKVEIKKKYKSDELNQIWDELRRKVNDAQSALPREALSTIVNDDYSDVYGIFFAITGEEFSYKELYELAKEIERELYLIPSISKIQIAGHQEENIFIEFSRTKLSNFGISQEMLFNAVKEQNIVYKSGSVKINKKYINIRIDKKPTSIEDIRNLSFFFPGTKGITNLKLKDIANISRGYKEVPNNLVRFNGKKTITMGISIQKENSNVLTLGKEVRDTLEDIKDIIPSGVSIDDIYYQPDYVQKSISDFIMNLVAAVVIVLIVLIAFMSMRVGLIISSILLINILGTFLFMYIVGIELQRISLGALIIALGMLVDNGVVISENILVGFQKGMNNRVAANQAVSTNILPLFGATIISIIAFAPIGLSNDNTGEYCSSLFYVMTISLSLSWFLAITVTPYLCLSFIPVSKPKEGFDPYDNFIFNKYRNTLKICLNNRSTVLITTLILFLLTVIGFTYVKKSFFPASTTPIIFLDYWKKQGTDIRAISKELKDIEQYVMSLDHVKNVSSFIGKGATRFTLTYTPETPNHSYAQLLINLDSDEHIQSLMKQIEKFLDKGYPEDIYRLKLIDFGPSSDSKIEIRVTGNDILTLRNLSTKIKKIITSNTDQVMNIRDDWRSPVKVISSKFDANRAHRVGIFSSDISNTVNMFFSGKEIGLYRENDTLIPIVATYNPDERDTIEFIDNIEIWSSLFDRYVPINQAVETFTTSWEDQIIRRRKMKRTLTIAVDPDKTTNANAVVQQIMPIINSLELPPHYTLEWGGDFENTNEAIEPLKATLSLGLILMFLIIIIQFNNIRIPVIIFLTLPLALIGIVIGLLTWNKPFDFMAILGFISLSGMLIKNSIVLIEKIQSEILEGKEPFSAIISSSVERSRPVVLSAATTALGMIPLIPDVFYSSMAISISIGLTFSTVITLIFVPVLFSVFFNINPKDDIPVKKETDNKKPICS